MFFEDTLRLKVRAVPLFGKEVQILFKYKKNTHFMGGKDLQVSFNFETKNKILAEIHNLDNKKDCKEGNIPVQTIKDNTDIFSEFTFRNFNNSIFEVTFSTRLKTVDVIPVFKKEDRNYVENYRPVSILPSLSKI